MHCQFCGIVSNAAEVWSVKCRLRLGGKRRTHGLENSGLLRKWLPDINFDSVHFHA
jgi:hypothetical protein